MVLTEKEKTLTNSLFRLHSVTLTDTIDSVCVRNNILRWLNSLKNDDIQQKHEVF